MKKFMYTYTLGIGLILFGCESKDIDSNITASSQPNFNSEIKASVIEGRIHFNSVNDFKSTITFLQKNQDYSLDAHSNDFQSFQNRRLELEKSSVKPSEEDVNTYFNKVVFNTEETYVSKINDPNMERIVNSRGIFSIGNNLYKFENNILYKSAIEKNNPIKFEKLSNVINKIERFSPKFLPKAREVQGEDIFSCPGHGQRRIIGEISNFEIGFYQHMRVIVKHQRRNTSFWSWVDPWVMENVSYMNYEANFTVKPAGMPVSQPQFFEGNCNNCSQLDRTIDMNIFAPTTDFITKYGTYGMTTVCGYKSYNF